MHQKREMFCFFFFLISNYRIQRYQFFFFFLPKTGKYVQLFPDLDNLQNRKNVQRKNKRKKNRRNRKFFWKLRCPNLATKKRRKIFEAILLCVSHTIILEIDKNKKFSIIVQKLQYTIIFVCLFLLGKTKNVYIAIGH